MKKLSQIVTLFLVAVSFNACTDDLGVDPNDPLRLDEEAFYSQPGAYTNAIGGVYANLSLTSTNGPTSSNLGGIDAGFSQYGRVVWYLNNLTTDEAIWSYEGGNDIGVRELQRNIWDASNPFFRGMFSRAMLQVALANEFLRQSTPEKLNSRGISTTEQAEIQIYREEARALRALAYYHLMDFFGKAAFNTENDAVGVAGPEYNRQQLFNFIESELLEILPNLKAPRTNAYGRLDQAFARMLLAKIYINADVYIGTPKYNECAAQCIELINAGYTLNPNYKNNFTADNHISPELIFTIQSDGIRTQNFGPTTVMINGQVGSLEQNGDAMGVQGWGGALRLRKQFVQKFDGAEFNNDQRKNILSGSRNIDITNVTDRDQGYILFKYSNRTSTGIAGSNSTFVDTDFPLFRFADVYLMYAECAVRGASNATMSQATTYINLLRQRANNGAITSNISQSNLTLDFILDERSRELHWEGHRRQDLIRFNKYTGGTYNWAWKGNGINGIALPQHMKIFPIHPATLSSNPNLTQNPGY